MTNQSRNMKEYAGFWLRFVAYIIDYIIIWVVWAYVAMPILNIILKSIGNSVATTRVDFPSMDDLLGIFGTIMGYIAAVVATFLLSWVLRIIYCTIMESSKYQATVGKLALGLIVTDEEGNKLDMAKALVRNLCKILSSMILLIGYIMVGFTEKKQGLHDILAKTLVVRK